jgi:small-conductance mechanosensitive channel
MANAAAIRSWFVAHEIWGALLLIVAFGLAAYLFRTVIVVYLRRLAERTETDWDDHLIKIMNRPVFTGLCVAGVYFALRTVSTVDEHLSIINNIFFVIGVAIVTWLVSMILAFVVSNWFKERRGLTGTPRLLTIFISAAIWLTGIIMVLSYFGIEITPFVAALGLGGLAVGLALQDTLSNIFAGLHLIGDQPIKVGDFIEIDDGKVSGFVDDIGWRTTRIKTLPNNYAILPNSKIAEALIINKSMPEQEMAVVIQCGVAYTADLKKVEKVTIDVARKIQKTTDGAVKKFEPFIRYHTFGDSNINFSIILRVKDPVAKFLVTHEFIKELKSRYDKEKIEISWPVRKIVKG